MENKIPKIIETRITGEYNDFSEFYSLNRTKIYDDIINCFELICDSKRKTIKYVVHGTLVTRISDHSISIFELKTDYFLKKHDCKLMIKTILTHFEEIEEYEKCGKIINLYKRLTKNEKIDTFRFENV
jgi:uncharacterized protein with WD repeat